MGDRWQPLLPFDSLKKLVWQSRHFLKTWQPLLHYYNLQKIVLTKSRRFLKIWHHLLHFYNRQKKFQLTLWGPNGEILDYASKHWSGLVSDYYYPRWKLFFDTLITCLDDGKSKYWVILCFTHHTLLNLNSPKFFLFLSKAALIQIFSASIQIYFLTLKRAVATKTNLYLTKFWPTTK